jgi:alpha-galactosidase
MSTGLLLLRNAGVGVVLDARGPGAPSILHWGADPGDLSPQELSWLARDLTGARAHSAVDEPSRLPLLPTQADGWAGSPGVGGHRDGLLLHPRLVLMDLWEERVPDDPSAFAISYRAEDVDAGLEVVGELRLTASGCLLVRHRLTNLVESVFTLDQMVCTLPIPTVAKETLDLTGRWCRERHPQRRPLQQGSWSRVSRRGRPGHDSPLLTVAGSTGFGFRHGEVWGTHLAWSGNQLSSVEALPEGAGVSGAAVIAGGELLEPGEVRLEREATYETPWLVAAWSDRGLDGLSQRLHGLIRARTNHPQTSRPLVLNSWEAIFFDHSIERLRPLVEAAARVGVERFVLDDGWFQGRRDDSRGLGDWTVDRERWPRGLGELADLVRSSGMQFGLWVEPEMVNPDSELARAHPEWLLHARARAPMSWRNQATLDLTHPDAYRHVLGRLNDVIDETGATFLKWDHNRDLLEAVTGHEPPAGDGRPRAAVHNQTLATYRLLDELRGRHLGLEIESCASGGARIDLGILERTDRVWASDTNDPLERQTIQLWTELLLPPELVGCHVGPPVAHTTGRTSSLSMRCITALFGHAGIEWDLTTCTPEELDALAAWALLYKELRPLLHSGDLVRADCLDPSALLHGVVSPDRSEALFAYVRLATSPIELSARLRLPGLDPGRRYRVVRRDEAGTPYEVSQAAPAWWARGETTARGAVLETIGLPAPMLGPNQACLIQLTTVVGPDGS